VPHRQERGGSLLGGCVDRELSIYLGYKGEYFAWRELGHHCRSGGRNREVGQRGTRFSGGRPRLLGFSRNWVGFGFLLRPRGFKC
jgi:hypothetical protein